MTHKPRMPRAKIYGFDGPQSVLLERLNSAAAAHPHHVTWHRPEHRSGSIEPGEGLGAIYLNGLRFGGER